jgi:hypothetical protein
VGGTLLTASAWDGHPRGYSRYPPRHPVLFFGGVGCDQTCAFNSLNNPWTRPFLDKGLSVFSTGTLAHQWANDFAIAEIDALVARAAADPNIDASKVLLHGGSQGSLHALAWGMRNAARVAAIACPLPIPSLAAMHDSPGAPSYAAEIEAAYGNLAGYQAAVASHDPDQNRAAFTMPIGFWYSNNDPTAPPAPALAFAAAVGASVTDMGAIGHSTNAAFADEAAEFLRARA